ncbi:MAG: fructose-bisphosphate aldolase class I [Candidatus Pacebacteria bacterium]|nr:fructose-bisphosphate aldolase class I [Candidatus Paceibacterota bacterium]
MTDLSDTAHQLVRTGKGILAADESVASADKRLAAYGIKTGPEMRRQFRDLFLAAPGIEDYLSGVILYEETLTQDADDGEPFAQELLKRGIIPGIKVDEGTEPIPESPDELITKGLLGLGERLENFRKRYHTGFTKWRAVIRIEGDRLPTAHAIVENAKRLASYALEVQRAGMVPIVEPEVLLEGNHSRLRSRQVLEATLIALMDALRDQGVDMSGLILKTSMALSGSETGKIDSPEEVAEDTVGALMKAVPADVAGVVFLSGGQGDDQATDNLRAIAKLAREKNAPWPLTFSYARALQDEALKSWAGDEANQDAARAIFIARLDKVADALKG